MFLIAAELFWLRLMGTVVLCLISNWWKNIISQKLLWSVCPRHPALRRSRFPVGTADIPALVNQAPPRCTSPVSESSFREAKQKPEVLRGTEVEEERGKERRRGGGTDACLWGVCALCINEPSLLLKVPPALQTIKGGDCHHDPLCASLCLTLKYSSSQRQQCVTMAKPNNWQFVNRTMCVCFRLTTAFPPSLSLTLLTPPRTGKLLVIGCGWIAGGRRGVLCVCSNDVWRRAAGWASSQLGIGCLSQADRQTWSCTATLKPFIIIMVLWSRCRGLNALV